MSLILTINVIPRSKQIKWQVISDNHLKCHLISPPEKNKANEELIALLSKALKIPKRSISIISGATSRKKQICIDADISFNSLVTALGLEQQLPLFSK